MNNAFIVRPLFRALVLGIFAWGHGMVMAQTLPSVEVGDKSFSAAQIPLIFPGMSTQGTVEARYQLPAGAQRVQLQAPDGAKIEAVFWPAPKNNDDQVLPPTLIYFYGNAQCIAYSLRQAALLRDCGANVLVADYLGFGLSEGKPSESGCYATAMALYEHAMSRRDIDRGKLIAVGWSLGAAVAIDLASKKEMAGLITFSAYTSKRELARRQFPNVSPLAIEHPFLSRDKIRNIHCPTLIVHGRLDTLVPFSMAEELRGAAAGKPLTFLPIDEAGHNDLFLVGEKPIKVAVRKFLEQVSRQPGPATRPG